jgi:hypothetical protein
VLREDGATGELVGFAEGPLWLWTATADRDDPFKALVFGGRGTERPARPDNVSNDGLTASVRSSSTPPFMGVRCALDADELMGSLPAGAAGPHRTDPCARTVEHFLDCLSSLCAEEGSRACARLDDLVGMQDEAGGQVSDCEGEGRARAQETPRAPV